MAKNDSTCNAPTHTIPFSFGQFDTMNLQMERLTDLVDIAYGLAPKERGNGQLGSLLSAIQDRIEEIQSVLTAASEARHA